MSGIKKYDNYQYCRIWRIIIVARCGHVHETSDERHRQDFVLSGLYSMECRVTHRWYPSHEPGKKTCNITERYIIMLYFYHVRKVLRVGFSLFACWDKVLALISRLILLSSYFITNSLIIVFWGRFQLPFLLFWNYFHGDTDHNLLCWYYMKQLQSLHIYCTALKPYVMRCAQEAIVTEPYLLCGYPLPRYFLKIFPAGFQGLASIFEASRFGG